MKIFRSLTIGLLILLIIGGIGLPQSSLAAIAFDSASSGSGAATGSFTHTVTGSNVTLVVDVIQITASGKVTSVDFNGTALTQVGAELTFGSGARWMTKWILVAPASGAHSITVTGAGAFDWAAVASSYTGTSATQPDAFSSSQSSSAGTTWTNTFTSTADNSWHVSGFTGNTISAGASTVERIEQALFGGIFVGMYDGNTAITPAGSDTLNFITTNSGGRAAFGVTLAPSTESGLVVVTTHQPHGGGVASGGSLNF